MDSFIATRELVERAKAGDETALGRICARYYERIRIPVRLRLGTTLRRRLDSNDILREVFRHLVTEIDRFEWRNEGSLLQYLTKMAVREICAKADYWFGQKPGQNREVRPAPREAAGETSVPDRDLTLDSPDNTSVLGDLVGSEKGKILEECLSMLGDEHCQVILMRDFLRMGWQQIQEELGSNTEDSVRELRRAALVKISALLRERGVHEDHE